MGKFKVPRDSLFGDDRGASKCVLGLWVFLLELKTNQIKEVLMKKTKRILKNETRVRFELKNIKDKTKKMLDEFIEELDEFIATMKGGKGDRKA